MSQPSKQLGAWIGLIAALSITLAPWWRNHTLISDPYDYSLMPNAVGKWWQGLRPYVDYESPLQSGSVLTNLGAEWLFGKRYLAITYANALLIVATVITGWRQLRKGVGPRGALVAAAGCALLCAGQHTVLWHSALATFTLGTVTWAIAAPPSTCRERWLVGIFAGGALIVGGMAKLNFQLVTVVFGSFLFVCHWGAGTLRLRTALSGCVTLGVLGLIVPVWGEMRLTGASWDTWRYNVIELPQSRMELLHELLTPAFYLSPRHDFYPWVYLPAPGAVIVLAAVALGSLLAVGLWRSDASRKISLSVLAVIGGFAVAIPGAGLIATNVDVVFVGLATPVALGWALISVFRPRLSPAFFRLSINYWTALTVFIGGFGWIAAWNGARVHYGNAKATHADFHFEPASGLPAGFAYFEGTRLDSKLLESFRAIAREVEPLGPAQRKRIFFTGGTEWLERVYPETTTSGLPLWFHEGTTYGRADSYALFAKMAVRRNATRIIAVPHWAIWPQELKESIDQKFSRHDLSAWAVAYRFPGDGQADALDILKRPVEFTFLGESNVMATRTHADRRLYAIDGPAGRFVATDHPTRWEMNFSSYRFCAQGVASLVDRPEQPVAVDFRVIAVEGGEEQLIAEKRVFLTSDQPNATTPFEVSPNGRHLRLETHFASPAIVAGWNQILIYHSGALDDPPAPLYPPLARVETDSKLYLFEESPWHLAWAYGTGPEVQGTTMIVRRDTELWSTTPTATRGLNGLIEVVATPGGATEVYLRISYYKSGRIELIAEKTVKVGREPAQFAFSRPVPEPEGWISIAILNPAKDDKPFEVRFKPFRREN